MKCAIYIRVSTDTDEQKTSLTYQKDLFNQYVKEHGWEIYDYYIDVESGTKSKRDDFLRLIEDAKNKKIDIILAKELSRLARNGELSYKIKNLAENNSINIVTLDNAINTLDGNTEMFGMYAWLYEQESQRLSERMKMALRARAKKGYYKGSFAPYGYYKKDSKLYIKNDNTPNIVKRIYKDYLSGKGFDLIARELTRDGIPTPGQVAGKSDASLLWHGGSVRTILENPHYTGDLVQCRNTTISVTSNKRKKQNDDNIVIIPNTHDAIISKKEFKLVQELILSRKKIRPHQKTHLFTNIVFCADCGHGMHFKANRKGYICGMFNKHGYAQCSSHLAKEDELINIIKSDLKYFFNECCNKDYNKLIEKHLFLRENEIQKKCNFYKGKIAGLQEKKNRCLSLLLDNTITKEDYTDYMSVIKKEIDQCETNLNNYTIKAKVKSRNINKNIPLIIDNLLNPKEITHDLIHNFINKIEIREDGSPIIHYKFTNPIT